MDCSSPGSSVHGIFQASILEWVAISFSRGSSQPRDQTRVSCISCSGGRFFTTKPPRKPYHTGTESQFRKALIPQMGKLKLTQTLYSPLSFPIIPPSTYSHLYHCFWLVTFLLKHSNCFSFYLLIFHLAGPFVVVHMPFTAGSRSYSLVAICGLLLAVGSVLPEHGL